MRIVGLDCATVDAKVGIALGVLREGHVEIQYATLCTRERAAANVIAGWVRDSQDPCIDPYRCTPWLAETFGGDAD